MHAPAPFPPPPHTWIISPPAQNSLWRTTALMTDLHNIIDPTARPWPISWYLKYWVSMIYKHLIKTVKLIWSKLATNSVSIPIDHVLNNQWFEMTRCQYHIGHKMSSCLSMLRPPGWANVYIIHTIGHRILTQAELLATPEPRVHCIQWNNVTQIVYQFLCQVRLKVKLKLSSQYFVRV
jgi:hypothetical protein